MDVPPASSAPRDATRTNAVTHVLGAMIFREILAPLTAALGPVGDALSDRVVDGIIGRPKP